MVFTHRTIGFPIGYRLLLCGGACFWSAALCAVCSPLVIRIYLRLRHLQNHLRQCAACLLRSIQPIFAQKTHTFGKFRIP